MKYYKNLLVGVLVVIFLFLAAIIFKVYPPVWPDESLYANVAQNWLANKIMGASLLQGYYPNVEIHGFGYPPLYFYLTAFWFKLWGIHIFTYRILSLLFGVGVLIFSYLYTLRFTLPNTKYDYLWGLLPGVLLISSTDFMRASIIARPEIVVIFLGLLAVFFHQLAVESKRSLYIWLSIFFAALSCLTHLPGLAFAIPIGISSLIQFRGKYLAQFLLACMFMVVMGLAIWPLYKPELWEHFRYFMDLRMEYNLYAGTWFFAVLSDESGTHRFVYALYLFLTLYSFYYFARYKYYFYFFLLISSWIFSLLWKQEYTFAITIVTLLLFIPKTLYLFIQDPKSVFNQQHNLSLTVTTAVVILFFLQLATLFSLIHTYTGSYQAYSEKILAAIPNDHSRVYLAAIPDPYFAFIEDKRNNVLQHFPPLPISEDKKSFIYSFDYYVFNDINSYVTNVFIQPLISYVQTHGTVITEYSPEETGGYGLIIIKNNSLGD